jgi:hypothetical protein
MEALSKWRKTHPELFKKPECNHPGLDSYLQVFSTVYLRCIARGIGPIAPDSPEELIEKIHAAYFGDNSGTANSSNP